MNSRYKDFYDIFILSRTFNFDGKLLQTAIRDTFTNRNTSIEEIVAFEGQFIFDPLHQKRWKAFLKKKNVKFDLSFDEVISHIKNFITPVLDTLKRKEIFNSNWQTDNQSWKS